MSGDALSRILFEHPLEQMMCSTINELVLSSIQKEIAGSILVEYIVVVLPRENRFPEQQDVKDESSREHITDRIAFGLHVTNVDDLWSNVTGCATPNEEVFWFVSPSCQTEVSNHRFTTSIAPKHNVLRF